MSRCKDQCLDQRVEHSIFNLPGGEMAAVPSDENERMIKHSKKARLERGPVPPGSWNNLMGKIFFYNGSELS